MVDWRKYTIIGITTPMRNRSYGSFDLNDYVHYSDGYRNYIWCKNVEPFNTFQIGDEIEIDNDQIRYNGCCHEFANSSQVRLAQRSKFRKEYKDLKEDYNRLENSRNNLQNELNEQKRINSGLVSMFNNFSVQMINETLTNSSYFTEYDLDNCRQKLKKIVDETGKKSEEQLALVARNSTDLSVTKESLRLTQVANLALQQQVGEKNQLINAGTGALQTTQTQLTTSQNQNRQKDTQITQLNNDLTTTRNQVGQLNTQIVTKDSQITQVTNERNTANEQLTLTRGQIEDLRTLFNNLQITNNNKEQAIRKKEDTLRTKEREIIELRTQLGLLSPEEVLNKKIASGEKELDDLTCTLSIPRQTIKNLRFAYKNLEFNTKVQYNSENIANIENDIEEIKEELLKFFVENNKDREELYKIYQSCEQIAKWKVELEQLYQQQYQARQEQPTNQ